MMKSQMDKLSITDRKMQQSLRTGHHATVYEVRRDPELKNKDVIRDKTKPVFPFISGSQYKGEWLGDVKSGFGVQVNPDNTKYEGEWSNNQYNGRGTLWMKKAKTYVRVYVGHWVNGNMEGDGIRYYDKYETYKGGWEKGQRCGKGKYEYSNGDQYVGEWHNDMRNGLGTLNCTNGNIFEGMWVDNLKEGPGLYYYASTRKVSCFNMFAGDVLLICCAGVRGRVAGGSAALRGVPLTFAVRGDPLRATTAQGHVLQ